MQELVQKMVLKGSRVYVEGALKPRKWIDASGIEKTTLEVVVRAKGEVVVVSRPGEQQEDHMNSSSSHEPL
jgi:single-strand DNA-binding protein